MSLLELLLVAVGLSMDAFSVAICKGLALRRVTPGRAAIVGLWFGGFQALMPALGYFLGDRFAAAISRYDHWIILVLLCLIGGNMIREALDKSIHKTARRHAPPHTGCKQYARKVQIRCRKMRGGILTDGGEKHMMLHVVHLRKEANLWNAPSGSN